MNNLLKEYNFCAKYRFLDKNNQNTDTYCIFDTPKLEYSILAHV